MTRPQAEVAIREVRPGRLVEQRYDRSGPSVEATTFKKEDPDVTGSGPRQAHPRREDTTRMGTCYRSSASWQALGQASVVSGHEPTYPPQKEEAARRRPLLVLKGERTVPSPFTPEPQRDKQSLIENPLRGKPRPGMYLWNSFDRCSFVTSNRHIRSDVTCVRGATVLSNWY
jgi:hypothetical protein